MKGCRGKIFAAALLLLVAGLLCGCGYTLDELSAAEQAEILAAYCAQEEAQWNDSLEEYREELVSLTGYCGTYGGHIVFTKQDANYVYLAVMTEVTVGGVHICTNPSSEINPLVYLAADAAADDRVLTLQEAYDGGFISQWQLRQIARNMP